jgi:hypothetical protein
MVLAEGEFGSRVPDAFWFFGLIWASATEPSEYTRIVGDHPMRDAVAILVAGLGVLGIEWLADRILVGSPSPSAWRRHSSAIR